MSQEAGGSPGCQEHHLLSFLLLKYCWKLSLEMQEVWVWNPQGRQTAVPAFLRPTQELYRTVLVLVSPEERFYDSCLS